MGSVRFELTIDGCLRYELAASVLQRIITKSVDPGIIICTNSKTVGARRHAGLGHDPLCSNMLSLCTLKDYDRDKQRKYRE